MKKMIKVDIVFCVMFAIGLAIWIAGMGLRPLFMVVVYDSNFKAFHEVLDEQSTQGILRSARDVVDLYGWLGLSFLVLWLASFLTIRWMLGDDSKE